MNCPVCEGELDSLDRHKDRFENVGRFFCDNCNVEYHQYPKENKEGVQMTGWHAYIPLKNFPQEAWNEFLFTEWNYYGQRMPERASSGYGPTEKEKAEAKEWYERVS